ncbi:phage tail protein [Aeromonas caviae]|uniref:phage tail-collar fiber domain-containing protein n=1 Tax=Aeromonas caviae TaxID=648 RepID=UPI0038D13FE7
MAYKCIHTTVGLSLMAEAEATGTQIRLTHVAVGDGNGNPVTPTEGMTQLVRERYRATVNRVWQDPDISNKFSAEMIVPASEGGFTLREVGVFDSNGNLFVVGNLPDTYKPTGSDGAYSDTVIRVDFMVSNASIVELIIDPNVIVATHQWVLNTITVCALLPGGTTGQVLGKLSNACGDAGWVDQTDVNVTVNSIEETQTLAASQTVVDWAVVNNTGLAVYVEGVRLRADQFTKHPTINTRITMAESYPAGAKIIGTQNEPAGTLPDPLVKSQNLADVPDKLQGRANLDVFSKSETRQMAPPGLVAHFARNTAPTGWLKANGAAVSRTAYADLFAVIGTNFGHGDGFNTFNLPDLRGEFIRGWSDGRSVDTGRALGSFQADAIRNITGNISMAGGCFLDSATGVFVGQSNTGQASPGTANGKPDDFAFDASRVVPTANENRPRNVALLACIKF